MTLDPVRFCVVGNGQAFAKYWKKPHETGVITIQKVIGIDGYSKFHAEHPDFSDKYARALNVNETINILKNTPDYDAIALIIPTSIKLGYVSKLLEAGLTDKLIYVEKPYAYEVEEIKKYHRLVEDFPNSIHLLSKYSFSRANILIQALTKERQLPTRIEAVMLEGTEYLQNLSPQFIKDGPELDLCFHMLDIVSRICITILGGYHSISINSKSVRDLSEVREGFEIGYGVSAQLYYGLNDGNQIDVSLEAGKGDCPTTRYIKLEYPDHSIMQTYTSPTADDHVHRIDDGREPQLIAKHPTDYNYYIRELLPSSFKSQSAEIKEGCLRVNKACIEIRNIRESA